MCLVRHRKLLCVVQAGFHGSVDFPAAARGICQSTSTGDGTWSSLCQHHVHGPSKLLPLYCTRSRARGSTGSLLHLAMPLTGITPTYLTDPFGKRVVSRVLQSHQCCCAYSAAFPDSRRMCSQDRRMRQVDRRHEREVQLECVV